MSDYLYILNSTHETCEQTPGRHVWVTTRFPPYDDDYCECGQWQFGDYCAERSDGDADHA